LTHKKIFLLLAILILVLGTRYSFPQMPDSGDSLGVSVHPLIFYDEKSFVEGINRAKNIPKPTYKITGGITPHDLTAGFILADFYKRLSKQKPATIILIGPNHYEKGNFLALTGNYGWSTPYGVVESDKTIIAALISRNLVKVDENTLENDHAVAGSMPFIKYYLPEAKVVPVLLSGRMTQAEASILAENLQEFVKENVVIVAAVDFSHYLDSKQAEENDNITLAVMKNFDYRQLFLMNNDFLDSPPSIGVLLMVMQKLGKAEPEFIFNANSGQLQKNNFIQTTSYFEIAYH